MNRFLFLSAAAVPLLADASLKGAALLALAGVCVLAMRRASAASRHMVWLAAVVALLVLPVLAVVLPGWRVLPRWASREAPAAGLPGPLTAHTPDTPSQPYSPPPSVEQPAAPPPAPLLPTPPPQPAAELRPPPAPAPVPATPAVDAAPLTAWLLPVWAAGCAVLLLRLAAAHFLLRRNTRRCEPATGPLAAAFEAAREECGVRQPVRVLLDKARTIPVVWGVIRPQFLIPGEAENWDATRLRSVLLHELAHLRRRDPLTQLLTQLACALHWFNPLVWLAAWRLHVERERACDDLVLSRGVRPSAYAEHLLHIATQLSPARWTQACGLAMARKSSIEGRLLAVLSEKLNRRSVTRTLAAAAILLSTAIAVPVAMLRAAPANKTDQSDQSAQSDKPAPTAPTHKEARALYEIWQRHARANGDIPGALIGELARGVRRFITYNPTWETVPKLNAILPRLDTSRDWKPADVIALLDEVAAVQDSPIGMALSDENDRTISPGQALPKELADKRWIWSGADPSGLRIGWDLEPRGQPALMESKQEAWISSVTPGTALGAKLFIHNTGRQPVIVRVPTWHQGVVSATNRAGEDLNTNGIEWTTLARLATHRLAPGEYVAIRAPGVGFGKDAGRGPWAGPRVGWNVDAPPGDFIRLTHAPLACDASHVGRREVDPIEDGPAWWTEFVKARLARGLGAAADSDAITLPAPAERALLLDRACRDLFGTEPTAAERTAFDAVKSKATLFIFAEKLAQRPGITSFDGTLTPPPAWFEIQKPDPATTERPRVVLGPGEYPVCTHDTMNVALTIVGRPDGDRTVNDAKLYFSASNDPNNPAPGPQKISLPDGWGTWAAVCRPDEGFFYILHQGTVRKIDFSIPAKVTDTPATDLPAEFRDEVKRQLEIHEVSAESQAEVFEKLAAPAETPKPKVGATGSKSPAREEAQLFQAKGPGTHDLAPGVQLVIGGSAGGDKKHATIVWRKDKGATADGETELELTDPAEAPFVWGKGSTALWIMRAERLTWIDFSNPGEITTTQVAWNQASTKGSHSHAHSRAAPAPTAPSIPTGTSQQQTTPAGEQIKDSEALTLKQVERFVPRNADGAFKLRLIDAHHLAEDPPMRDFLTGRNVELTGTLVKSGQDLIFHTMHVTCCAAVAFPVRLGISPETELPEFSGFAPYRLSGKLHFAKVAGGYETRLAVSKFEEDPEFPAEPPAAATQNKKTGQVESPAASVEYEKGLLAIKAGDRSTAEGHFLKAIELDAKHAAAHFNLSVLFATQHPPRLVEAKEYYLKGLALGEPRDKGMDKLLAVTPVEALPPAANTAPLEPGFAVSTPSGPAANAKLDAATEAQLDWGEAVNGLRGALMVRSPGEGKLEGIYLLLQNVSEGTVRFMDKTKSERLRTLYLSDAKGVLAGLSNPEPTMTDVTLQPREVVFLNMMRSDAAAEVAAGLIEGIRKDSLQTWRAVLRMSDAPEGWKGELTTGETRCALREGGPLPKNASAQALFKHWQSSARLNGDIPGGLVRLLHEKVKDFIRANEPDASGGPYAQKMKPLEPRFANAGDWKAADVVALLDDIAAAHTIPLDNTLTHLTERTLYPGTPLPASLEKADWGEPLPSGLRVAHLLEPRAGAYHLGTELKARILFHNTGKEPVTFITDTFQQPGHSAKRAGGGELKLDATEWTTLGSMAAYRLAPGDYCEVHTPGLGVGAPVKGREDWEHVRAGSWILCAEGDEVVFTPGAAALSYRETAEPPADWWLEFITERLNREAPVPTDTKEREYLLYRVVRDLYGAAPSTTEGDAFAADKSPDALKNLAALLAKHPYGKRSDGVIRAGSTKFRVLPPDADADKRPRIVTGPGSYTLGDGINFYVTRQASGSRVANEASIIYFQQGKDNVVHKVALPAGYDTWAAGMMKGAKELWVSEFCLRRKLDFSNPLKVVETRYEGFDTTNAPIPKELRGVLDPLISKPVPGATKSKPSSPPPAEAPAAPATEKPKGAALTPAELQERYYATRKEPLPVGIGARAVLIRSLTLEITGELPTMEERTAFENDKEPDALGKVIARLVAKAGKQPPWLMDSEQTKTPQQPKGAAADIAPGDEKMVFIPRVGRNRPFPLMDAGDGVTLAIHEQVFHGADVMTTVRIRYTAADGTVTGHDVQVAMDAFGNRAKWAFAWVRGTKTFWHVDGRLDGKQLTLYRTDFADPRHIVTAYDGNYEGEPLDALGIPAEVRTVFEKHFGVVNPKLVDKSGGLPDVASETIAAARPANANGSLPEIPVPMNRPAGSRWQVRFVDAATGAAVPRVRMMLTRSTADGSRKSFVTRVFSAESLDVELEHDEYGFITIADDELTNAEEGLRLFGNAPAEMKADAKHTNSAAPFVVKLKAKPATVEVGNNGALRLNGKAYTLDALKAAAAHKPGAFVIRADKEAPFAKVQEVVEALKNAGVKDVSFANTQPVTRLTPESLLGTWRGMVNEEKLMLSFHRPPAEKDVQCDIYFGEATIGALAGFTIAADGSSAEVVQHSAGGGMKFGTLIPNEPGKLKLELYGRQKGQQETMLTRGPEAASTEPRQKEARELFEMWKLTANADGTIPGTFIGMLATEVRAFVKANPTLDSAAKLPKLLPRFVTSRDWTQAEAIKLLDDVAYYSTKPIEARVAKAKLHSGPMWRTMVEFQDIPVAIAKWSEAKDGLRIGLRVVGGKWSAGGSVRVELWLHNASGKDVSFRTAGPNRQDAEVMFTAIDAEGHEHWPDRNPVNLITTLLDSTLPAGHVAMAKEFDVTFADADNDIWTPLGHRFRDLKPGKYQLRSTLMLAKPERDKSAFQAELRAGEHIELTAPDLAFTLGGAAVEAGDAKPAPKAATNADDSYAPIGVSVQDIPVANLEWCEEQNGMCVGLLVPEDRDWRIGGEVKVELWVCNPGENDVKFHLNGRSDIGLRVKLRGADGKEHDATIAQFRRRPVFAKQLLKAGHAFKAKEFTVQLAKPKEPTPAPWFDLPAGDYKFRCEVDIPGTTGTDSAGKQRIAAEGEWSGTLKSGEVDVKLLPADSK